MGSKKHRNHSRAEILARREADDERRGTQQRIEPTKRKELYNPGLILPYNRYQSISKGGIILIKPKK